LAIDALEAAAAIKLANGTLTILQDLYWKEAMYLGLAFTSCRQAAFARTEEEANKTRQQGHDYYKMTSYLVGQRGHFCDQVERYEKNRANRTMYEFMSMSVSGNGV